MKEILGGNLKRFFDTIDSKCNDADITYAGNKYEVWEVSDELFNKMCDMSEEEFVELAGEDAWWRSSEGSNLGTVDQEYIINGYKILAWDGHSREECCETCCLEEEEKECECIECLQESRECSKLTEYMCDEIGASQPKNVCACAMDLAKYNGMSMGALFQKYEG